MRLTVDITATAGPGKPSPEMQLVEALRLIGAQVYRGEREGELAGPVTGNYTASEGTVG